MIRPININDQESIVDLQMRKYRVFILGGWKIRLNDFSMTIRNIETNENARIKKSFFPLQSFAYNRRAKRIFDVEVPAQGKYQINFQNPHSVEVRQSNLPFFSTFYPPRLNKELDILITTKSGFQTFIK